MILSSEKCKELIDSAEEKNSWQVRKFGSSVSYQTTSCKIDTELDLILREYCAQELKINIIKTSLNILKYEVGDLFGRHKDQDKNIPGQTWLFNINVRLNDDYEGGEFFLNDSPYHQPVGKFYHYKSSEYHEVKKITKGVRYSGLFYIEFDNVKDKKRTIL